MYLGEDDFKQVIANAPLISIDIIVRGESGAVLLGKRQNRPAKGFWFVPGGRIKKGESFLEAFARLLREELNIKFDNKGCKFLGVYEHFYADCVFSEDISTHYVAIAYEVVVDLHQLTLPTEQHCSFSWFSEEEIVSNQLVHQHTQNYFIKHRSADSLLVNSD